MPIHRSMAGMASSACDQLSVSGRRMSDGYVWAPRQINDRQLNSQEVGRLITDLVTSRCPENL